MAIDFDKASDWVSAVPKSHKMENCILATVSSMIGRIGKFSHKKDGPYANERIVLHNQQNYELKVLIQPKNGNLPVAHNNILMKVVSLEESKNEVIWDSNIEFKLLGEIMFPMIKWDCRNFQ